MDVQLRQRPLQLHYKLPVSVQRGFRLKVFGRISAHLAGLTGLLCLASVVAQPPPDVERHVQTTAPAPSPAGGFPAWVLALLTLVVLLSWLAIVLEAFDLLPATTAGTYDLNLQILAFTQVMFFDSLSGMHGSFVALRSCVSLIWGSFALAAAFAWALASIPCRPVFARRGRGFGPCGVKLVGLPLSEMPSLPVLLSWLCTVIVWRHFFSTDFLAVVISFCVVWQFLVHTDGLLRLGDPDDYFRPVALLHSKVAALFAHLAVRAICIFFFGSAAVSDIGSGPLLFEAQVSMRTVLCVLTCAILAQPHMADAGWQRAEARRRRMQELLLGELPPRAEPPPEDEAAARHGHAVPREDRREAAPRERLVLRGDELA